MQNNAIYMRCCCRRYRCICSRRSMERSSGSCKLPACGTNPQQPFAPGFSVREGRDSEMEKGYVTRTQHHLHTSTYLLQSNRAVQLCEHHIFQILQLPSKLFAPTPCASARRQHCRGTQSRYCKSEEVATVYTKADSEPKPMMWHEESKRGTPAAVLQAGQRGLDKR
jgi:hypothetical protein